MEWPIRNSLIAAAAMAAAGTATACHAAESAAASGLKPFERIWEVNSRGPGGQGGGPPGTERGGAQRPPREGGARRGPPPGEGPPRQDGPVVVEGLEIEGLDLGDARTYSLMTPAGQAAFRAMDPRDLPANNCKSNGLPSLVGIPDVQQWSVEGDVLTIRYANFNTVRTIYLDGRPASGERSLYGHSTGRFEDGEFVIATTGYTATPGGLGRNAPGSASRTTVERYRLVGGDVTGSITIHDPEYLTRDFVRPINFVPAEGVSEIPDLPCDVEASQRYLD